MSGHRKRILEDYKNIIDLCIAGNVRAQESFYRMLAPKMFGVCLRYSKDNAEAEDNLQEGFIRVFTSLHNFRHEGSLEGWVRRIMVNVSLEKFRKQNMLYPVDDMRAFEPQHATDDIIAAISADELISLIQKLPPRYRMVFNLHVFEGMNHKEIGEAMNISDGTSKSNLARARDILKNQVAILYGERLTANGYTS